jgi:hypothetical protein
MKWDSAGRCVRVGELGVGELRVGTKGWVKRCAEQAGRLLYGLPKGVDEGGCWGAG